MVTNYATFFNNYMLTTTPNHVQIGSAKIKPSNAIEIQKNLFICNAPIEQKNLIFCHPKMGDVEIRNGVFLLQKNHLDKHLQLKKNASLFAGATVFQNNFPIGMIQVGGNLMETNEILLAQNTNDFKRNLENSLNTRDIEFIRKQFRNEELQNIPKQFSKFINDFPDSKWKILNKESNIPNKDILGIKVSGEKIINDEKYILESNFDYMFSVVNDKIDEGIIKNIFTTIRNDDKKIDITFKIPDKVLTGTKYDIDIILNKPLEIIAGEIKHHQVNSEQDIVLEPLVSGGIFKTTRAPSKPGIQILSGIIVHPEGIITFTKSIDIVDEI